MEFLSLFLELFLRDFLSHAPPPLLPGRKVEKEQIVRRVR